MHHAAVTEAHLMLGRVHVDIHHRRVQLEKEYEGRVPAVEQHVPVGLAHRMGDQLVTDHPAIDAEILQIRLTAGKGRQPHPAPEPQTAALLVDGHRLLDEGGTADAGHPAPGFLLGMCRSQAEYGTAVVTQIKATSKRDNARRLTTSSRWPNSVFSVRRNLRRAGVLKNRSRTSTVVPCGWAAG